MVRDQGHTDRHCYTDTGFLGGINVPHSIEVHQEETAAQMVTFRMGHEEWGFPGSSAGKESACNAGDPSSIPGSGGTPGEGLGCPLQYSWASLVAQTVKYLPEVQETWVRSLGWENPLKEGMATHSSILVWRSPKDRGAWWAVVQGVTKSWT